MLKPILLVTGLLSVASTAIALQGTTVPHHVEVDAAPQHLWVDYDGDGLDDLHVLDVVNGDQLYRNRGDGGFEDVTARAGLDGSVGSRLAIWEDYDADGALDYYRITSRGSHVLFRGLGDGYFQDVSGPANLPALGTVVDASWTDYDADGAPDLRISTGRHELVLAHNLGGGTFETVRIARPGPGISQAPADRPGRLDPSADPTPELRPDHGAGDARDHDSGTGGEQGTGAAPIATRSLLPPEPAAATAPGPATYSGRDLGHGGDPENSEAVCADDIKDQGNPGNCLLADSRGRNNRLLPLSKHFFVEADEDGDVGLGLKNPKEALHIVDKAPAIRLQDSTVANEHTLLRDKKSGIFDLNKIRPSGPAVLRFTPNPKDGFSTAFVDFLRWTNTTGSKGIRVFRGDATNTVDMVFSDLRMGIGTGAPIATMDILDNGPAQGRVMNLQRTQIAAVGNDMLQIRVTAASPDQMQFIECERGSDVKFRVNGNGDVFSDGNYTGPADFAEMIRVSTGGWSVEPGDVMVIDPAQPRSVVRSSTASSTLVAGIYSTRPGFVGSERDWDRTELVPEATRRSGPRTESSSYTMEDMAREFGEVPMAVVGIVPCKVSTENGPIRPGDLLVTSATPGHAMRHDSPANGTIVGKALESLSHGTGFVRVLVTLQ